ncbi:MAG: PepSY-like domain-containing protein [Paraprevotella sp.]|nr:PepSY-like domain-containing protein [Paraprevotella sp.]
MKKLTFILVCLLTLCAATISADNERAIQVSQLPAAAQQFIKKHFASRQVALAQVENNFISKEYNVVFSNGDNIEFDNKGNWKEIDCKFSSIPTAVIPAQIMKYVQENYTDTTIKKIEKDRRKYEVKLSNRMELSFDLKFNLIDIDL